MAEKRKKPNLLFFYSDEHRRDSMGFVDGGDPVNTPHFDAFSRNSVVFDNAIVEIPVCMPSRMTLFTGKRGMSHGAPRMPHPMFPGTEDNDLFSVLKRNGYHTGYIGKWHLLNSRHHQWRLDRVAEDPSYFSRKQKGPDGIEYSRAGFVPECGRASIDYWVSNNNNAKFWQQVLFENDPDNPEVFYEWETDATVERAIQYLKQKRDKDKPFACFYSLNLPHPGTEHDREGNVVRFNTNVAPEKWERPYRDLKTTGRANFGVDSDTFIDGYYGAVSSVDDAFGRLIATLKEIGEYENTIIVYTSDHGDLVGSHGKHAKSTWFEESIGVPLMISYPGLDKPRNEPMLFSNVHLMPTLLGLMGLDQPEGLDGQDYSRALHGDSVETPQEELIGMYPTILRNSEHDFSDLSFIPIEDVVGSPGWWGEWRGLRTPTHTYAVQYFKAKVKRYLYDNVEDPYQMRPIHEESAIKEFDRRLERKLHPQDPFRGWVWS